MLGLTRFEIEASVVSAGVPVLQILMCCVLRQLSENQINQSSIGLCVVGGTFRSVWFLECNQRTASRRA